MNLPEELINTGKLLQEAAAELIIQNAKLQGYEEEYKLVRATVMNMNAVVNLPNQAQRDAAIDQIITNHEEYAPRHREYLETKLAQRQAWIMYETRKEINENIRVLVNNATFSKKD